MNEPNAFNRTNMELKPSTTSTTRCSLNTFNRTNMELKRAKRSRSRCDG